MPSLGGVEVLRRLKADPQLSDVPVIILSASQDEAEIRQAQELKAHTHIVKPMSLHEFDWIVRSAQAHWPRLLRLREISR
jgi:CheY-like chemotaxis protein